MAQPASSTSPDLARPAALAAFLRGVERRAAVLAELQAGDATLGDAALTRAMAGFRMQALEAGMADWPRLFWAELLSQPALRRATHARLPAFMPACSAAVRAALLLRLAAGLEAREAAAVLQVAEGSLRLAVVRALPSQPDGSPDASAWVRLQGEVQQRIRGLPTERSLRLARMREGALTGPAERFFPTQPRWPRGRLVPAAAALTALALGGTVWLERRDDAGIEIAALPRAGEPASRYSPVSALISHPDFELLADPDSERLARDAAFLAWTVGRPAVTEEALSSDVLVPIPETGGTSDAP